MVIREQRFSFSQVRQVLGGVLDHDLHAKRVASLSDATLGVLRSASLAVCTVGRGLAAARGLNPKHATKQVDRLLSNPKINIDDILARWVPYVVGARTSIVVALDWTDFEADKQATIMLSLITDHGRATPLVWLTVDKRTLKDNRSLYEHRVLVRLAELLPADIKVCVVADRGFGDQKLYKMLTEELCFDYEHASIEFCARRSTKRITGRSRGPIKRVTAQCIDVVKESVDAAGRKTHESANQNEWDESNRLLEKFIHCHHPLQLECSQS